MVVGRYHGIGEIQLPTYLREVGEILVAIKIWERYWGTAGERKKNYPQYDGFMGMGEV